MDSLGIFVPILIFAIPLAPFLLGGLAICLRHQRKMAERSGESGALLAPYARRIHELEDRVRVLERIVTDSERGSTFSAEIESLRDVRPAGNDLESIRHD